MEPQFGHMRVTSDIPGGHEVEGDPNETFVLHSMYILPWRGDLDTHAELLPNTYVTAVTPPSWSRWAPSAVWRRCCSLTGHASSVNHPSSPWPACREWRKRVMQHALRLAAEADEAGERYGGRACATAKDYCP